jgi:hypothetical protein
MDRVAARKCATTRIPSRVEGVVRDRWRVEFYEPRILLLNHGDGTALRRVVVIDRLQSLAACRHGVPVNNDRFGSAGGTAAQISGLAMSGGQHIGCAVTARVV